MQWGSSGSKEEAENAFASMVDRWLADRDFVTREEFDAVKAMAQKAREENKDLKADRSTRKQNSF